MRNPLSGILILLLFSCVTSENKVEDSEETESVCDCKDLQHDVSYNVFHLGDRLKPFTGKCFDYYRGGAIKKDYTLLDGKYEGELLYYHPNGELQSSCEYQKGLLFGDKKVYDQSGQLLFHGIYKRTKLKEVVFNINDKSAKQDSINLH